MVVPTIENSSTAVNTKPTTKLMVSFIGGTVSKIRHSIYRQLNAIQMPRAQKRITGLLRSTHGNIAIAHAAITMPGRQASQALMPATGLIGHR
jgi:hypothetical protein